MFSSLYWREIFSHVHKLIQRNAKTTQGHQGTSRGEWQKKAGGKGKAVDKGKGVGKGKGVDKSIKRIGEANLSTG